MLILFLYCFLPAISATEFLTSATIRDDNLYTINQHTILDYVKLKVYKLKEGPTIDMLNSEKSFESIHYLKGFRLVFIDILDNSYDSKNKLWVRAELSPDTIHLQNLTYINWVGYIKLDDMSLKTDSSIFQFPTHENFPIKEYTTNKITNQFGTALYITGGLLYSKKDNKYSAGNSFFKYNFTTKEWLDMSYSFNGKSKPMVYHKSVVIDNRYLVILGGYSENGTVAEQNLNNSTNSLIPFTLYNLRVFDTYTSSWKSINIEPDMFDIGLEQYIFYAFLPTVYKDRVIVLGGTVASSKPFFGSYSKLGILYYNSKTLIWSPIYSDDDTRLFDNKFGQDSLLYNDQLIIVTGIIKIYIY
jgi:hypothetical protein